MKIAVAQTRPVKGDIQSNISNHRKWIDRAVSKGADSIIFPELSLTGYEPSLSKDLATDQNDSRFDDFQHISDHHRIAIGAGMPVKSDSGILIAMIIFQPHQPRQIYSKQYLHSDEEPYFVSGQHIPVLTEGRDKIAMAICYELSVPAHAANAYNNGAEIYMVSVAKTAGGVENAAKTLSGIAGKYGMTVLMSNSVGLCEDGLCAGRTAVWDNKGLLLAQLNDTDEGIIIFDTVTGELIKMNI